MVADTDGTPIYDDVVLLLQRADACEKFLHGLLLTYIADDLRRGHVLVVDPRSLQPIPVIQHQREG